MISVDDELRNLTIVFLKFGRQNARVYKITGFNLKEPNWDVLVGTKWPDNGGYSLRKLKKGYSLTIYQG